MAQLAVGSVFVIPLWLTRLRQAPGLSGENIKGLAPIAFCHMMSHVCAVIGLGGETSAGVCVSVPVATWHWLG